MRKLMKTPVFLVIILSSFLIPGLDKQAFYDALAGRSKEILEAEISKLEGEKSSSLKNAYTGALLMKKAEFEKGAGNKVKIFKKGANLLEDEITENPGNVEYRFLRLTIQEHAPAILKYNKEIEKDKRVVLSGFEKLEPGLQKIVKKYSNGSRIIKPEELK